MVLERPYIGNLERKLLECACVIVWYACCPGRGIAAALTVDQLKLSDSEYVSGAFDPSTLTRPAVERH